MNSHFACNEEIKRLKKELSIADRFGEDMYRKVQNLEAMMKQTTTCAKCGAEITTTTRHP
jgi:ribosomal protein L37AE/L43A